MKTLVTGANGFVGKRLMMNNPDFLGCDLISDSQRVQILDVSDVEALAEYCNNNEIKRIIHLAGAQYTTRIPRRRRVEHFYKGNVLLASSVADVASRLSLKQIIFLSTDMVYGIPNSEAINELTETKALGPYGKSKIESERILNNLSSHMQVLILRPRLIIGDGRRGTIEQLAKWIDLGLPIPIIGKGLNRYQFIGVDDVVTAITSVFVSQKSATYNIASNNPPQVGRLLPSVITKLGRKNKIFKLPGKVTKFSLSILDWFNLSPLVPEQFRIADVDYVLDTTKIKSETDWSPIQQDEEMLYKALKVLLGK